MRLLNASIRLVLVSLALGLLGASYTALHASAEQPRANPSASATDITKADPADAKRIAELEQALTHATLVGRFTTTGEDGGRLTEERYELGEVKHLGKGQWLIQARIKYRDRDLTLPLALPIHWAGDTPVITVDNVAFPGLGTYSARVMIYHDHYAGFWTGNNHGGHLFGLVERGENRAAPAPDAEPGGQSPAK
jgi:hypothetical protein